MKALTIAAEGTHGTIEIDPENSLKELQAAVGGYIETVLELEDLIVFANEEGLLMGLPVAPYATLLVNTLRYQNNMPALGMLVGDVIIVGRDEEGEIAELSDEWIVSMSQTINELEGR
jgi:hypothetical protein